MTDRASRRDEAGVTLVELMIVLVIVAVGVLALSAVQTRSSADVHATGRNTRALQLAEARMEVARISGYAGAVSDSGASGIFTWRTLVDSAGIGLRGVDVTVRWAEHGAPAEVRLHNLMARR